MVIVDMVEVDIVSSEDFGYAGIPGRVVDGTFQIVHSRRVWFYLRLLLEYWSVEKDEGYVAKSVAI